MFKDISWPRLIAGALLGAFVWWLGIRYVFGAIGPYLADPELQSEKFIAFWRDFKPPPRHVLDPWVWAQGLPLVTFFYSLVYGLLRPMMNFDGILRRGLFIGALYWMIGSVWFEFVTPWNFLHEPLGLALLELGAWAITMALTGLAVAFSHEYRRATLSAADEQTDSESRGFDRPQEDRRDEDRRIDERRVQDWPFAEWPALDEDHPIDENRRSEEERRREERREAQRRREERRLEERRQGRKDLH